MHHDARPVRRDSRVLEDDGTHDRSQCACRRARAIEPGELKHNVVFRWFNRTYDRVSRTYVGHIGSAVRLAPRWMVAFVAMAVLCGFLFTRMPGSFLPEEDQGYALAIVQLPSGATLQRTKTVMGDVRETLGKDEAFDAMM